MRKDISNQDNGHRTEDKRPQNQQNILSRPRLTLGSKNAWSWGRRPKWSEVQYKAMNESYADSEDHCKKNAIMPDLVFLVTFPIIDKAKT